MKTRTEIEDHIRALLVAELDSRVQVASRRLPHICVHNHRQPLDIRRQVDGEPNEMYNRVSHGRSLPVLQTMGLCMLNAESPEEWPGTICEDPIDAQRCPDFTPILSKESVYATFVSNMTDPEWIQQNHPEMYGLIWVLDDNSAWIRLPLWKRLWYRLLRIRVEKVREFPDLTKLLPESLGD